MDGGAEPLSSPGRRDRRGLRPGDQRLHRADRARAGAAAGRVPHPGDQAGQVDARGRGLAAQRAVSQRHRRRWSTPSSSTSWGRPAPGAAQPAPRPSRARARPGRSTCRSSPTRSSRPIAASRAAGPVPARGRRARVPRRSGERDPGRTAIAAADPIDPALAPHRTSIATPRGATTGRSPARGRSPAPRSWPTTRTASLLLPSLRYWVHLVAPGWNVIGAGEPALPGVSVGHNEHGAWGFTIFPIDQEDLYVYETDPADPSRYRYRDGWEAMRTVRETIAVKGAAPVAVDLKFTRHGPVVCGRPRPIIGLMPSGPPGWSRGARLTWRACGWTRPRAGTSSARRAGSSGSLPRTWSGPIATATSAGRRWAWPRVARDGTGCLPVPGDGRYEWAGFLPASTCRSLADPPRGWIASANQDNLPPGYPFAVSYQWTDPFRFARIEEVLGSARRLTLMDSMQLQQDELSLPARSLVPMLRGLKPGRRRHGRRDRAAAGLGLRDGQGLDPRGHLRDLGAAPEALGPRPAGAGRGAAAGGRPVAVDREADRLADGPRRPLRRRPDRRARRAVAPRARPRRGGADASPGSGDERLAVRPGPAEARPAQASR